MKYDFDIITDRRNTDSLKYDFAPERGMPEGLLPMWVADMDFHAPTEVITHIRAAADHGIFGYAEAKDDYYEAVTGWFSSRFGYSASRKDIVKTPGVVFALAQMIRAFTEPGDAVLIQPPVYYPFFEIIEGNDRKLTVNPLRYEDGVYSIDFEDFEGKIINDKVKLFILCSPHNPVGRVWTRAELERMDGICRRLGVIIVSDEIHCDFVWEGSEHTCFGVIDEDAVVATSPSKSFNLAGLQVSNIFVKNPELRLRLKKEIAGGGYSQLNSVGLGACRSAYLHGGEWLRQLKAYLRGNIGLAQEFIADRLPEAKLVRPEGTYLLWLDFSAYHLPQAELDRRMSDGAGLWLDSGTIFGPEGEGFQRINIACPRSVVHEALERLGKEFGGQ